MSTRRNRTYTSADGLIARAGRATEDPHAMTVPATITRMAKYVAAVLKENPELTADEAARSAALVCRADMARLARKSAQARAASRTATT